MRLDVDERRQQLLELGLTVFGATDYESVSIDDIAEKAGISKGLLYHYFASKRGFYVAVVRYAAERLRDHLQPDPELAPLDRAKVGITTYLQFVEERAEAYVALMRSGIGSDPEVYEIVEETRTALVARILEGAGLDPNPMLSLATRSWVGMVEAAALDWLDQRQIERDVLVGFLSDMLAQAVVGATSINLQGGSSAPKRSKKD